jgi:ATP-dependent protease ClpP protease subunit
MYLKLIRAVEIARINNKFILLHINSIGGENKWSMSMRKLLFKCHEEGIETYAVGYKKVHSAALLVYLSCVFRIAYKETKFLIHYPSPTESEKKSFLTRGLRTILTYYTHVTKFTLSELYDLAKKKTYVDYDEAVRKGIVNYSDWKIKAELRKAKNNPKAA